MKILVLDDGNRGNLIQSLGIAENLSDDIEIFKVLLKGPSYSLPKGRGTYRSAGKIIGFFLFLNAVGAANLILKIFSNVKKINNKKFDIIVSTGSYLAPINACLSITKKIFSVCILTPEGTPLRFFSVIFVPKHDVLRHPRLKRNKNIVITIGAPNMINRNMLAQWSIKLNKRINESKVFSPYKIGIVIGGNDQNYFIDGQVIDRLFDYLVCYNVKKDKEETGFLLTTSKRTPLDIVYMLKEKTERDKSFIYCEFPGLSRESFYFGILGLSDILIVTEDSVNMISECCSTGKPVLILGVKRRKNKKLYFDETIKELVENNYCMYLPYQELYLLAEKTAECRNRKYNRLNEAQICAEIVKEKIKEVSEKYLLLQK